MHVLQTFTLVMFVIGMWVGELKSHKPKNWKNILTRWCFTVLALVAFVTDAPLS